MPKETAETFIGGGGVLEEHAKGDHMGLLWQRTGLLVHNFILGFLDPKTCSLTINRSAERRKKIGRDRER